MIEKNINRKRIQTKTMEHEISIIIQDKCPRCGKNITVFKDEISEKEYRRSGLCQSCQDELYNELEELTCCDNYGKE